MLLSGPKVTLGIGDHQKKGRFLKRNRVSIPIVGGVDTFNKAFLHPYSLPLTEILWRAKWTTESVKMVFGNNWFYKIYCVRRWLKQSNVNHANVAAYLAVVVSVLTMIFK